MGRGLGLGYDVAGHGGARSDQRRGDEGRDKSPPGPGVCHHPEDRPASPPLLAIRAPLAPGAETLPGFEHRVDRAAADRRRP